MSQVSNISPKVVLCVGHEADHLMKLGLLLSVAGYQVLGAGNADAALKLFRGHRVDLVITDTFLSGGTVAGMTAHMKRLGPTVPIALLTTAPQATTSLQHIDHLIMKCISPAELLLEIATLCTADNSAQ